MKDVTGILGLAARAKEKRLPEKSSTRSFVPVMSICTVLAEDIGDNAKRS